MLWNNSVSATQLNRAPYVYVYECAHKQEISHFLTGMKHVRGILLFGPPGEQHTMKTTSVVHLLCGDFAHMYMYMKQ